MTDITELAQSLKAAAEKATQGNWRAFKYHDGRCGIGGGHHDEIMVCEHISKRRPHDAEFIALANPANVLALVEELEKAQQYAKERDEENQDLMLTIGRFRVESEGLESIRAAAEKLVRGKGRYHSEQNYRALAALFGVTTPDLPPLDSESSAVTVKLTDINEFLAEVHDKTLNRAFRLLAEGVRAGDVAAMRAAGIKVEAE
ncbi:TPA: ead/Ea22-like family protein [Klebsiella pneumoniae]|uniref:ead/Ea22-like family protein n=1 Tax=Klebsiella pneumoniae TaxID=573 RepID=UPI00073C6598|nr:ead/Ea22-like family protein [Klebsiella pneumoniae]EIV3894899.1 ead/Ea22-like family protein [Klebsiella pneumoniae]EIW4855209.1 ead/Ea22-like family protein [Klebsiella pneumoniae]EIW5026589.1 ead/Ea22-like family protein [Klebsiella pneumoniae]EKU1334435.1 ead/Ea22-like family protein [Klebsiella pneumoniae]EKV7476693.1 ead/Ea22-like family protein [Klebsiella pneumoniae]